MEENRNKETFNSDTSVPYLKDVFTRKDEQIISKILTEDNTIRGGKKN